MCGGGTVGYSTVTEVHGRALYWLCEVLLRSGMVGFGYVTVGFGRVGWHSVKVV